MKLSLEGAIALVMLTLFCMRSFATESLPYYTAGDFTPVWGKQMTPKTELTQLKSFSMKDQEGHDITEKNFSNNVTIVNFFYATCGGICPMTMSKLKTVNESLANVKGVNMLSFTITPNIDTPEKLKEYAKTKKLNLEHWHLLTGSSEMLSSIEKVMKADKDVPSKKIGETIHSENVYLLDSKGLLRGVYNAGSGGDRALLVSDVKALLNESK